MKIIVSLEIDVDPTIWALDHGLSHGLSRVTERAVRTDVRQYVLNHVQQAAAITDARADVTLAHR